MSQYHLIARLKLWNLLGYKQKFTALWGGKQSMLHLATIDNPTLANQQWHTIYSHLPQFQSFADIGGWRGYFSFKMLEHYPTVQATMIEASPHPSAVAKLINQLLFQSLMIHQQTLSQDNCHEFCSVDVVLLLSVFHQWYVFLGEEKALSLLKTIWKHTQKSLFFSMADNRSHNKSYKKGLLALGTHSEEILGNIKKILMNLDNAKITHLGDLPYWTTHSRKGGNYRHLFKIDKTLAGDRENS